MLNYLELRCVFFTVVGIRISFEGSFIRGEWLIVYAWNSFNVGTNLVTPEAIELQIDNKLKTFLTIRRQIYPLERQHKSHRRTLQDFADSA